MQVLRNSLIQTIITIWDRMWFKSETTLNLDVIRTGLGFCMLIAGVGLIGHIEALYGNQGWVSYEAIYLYRESVLHPSLLFYLDDKQLIYAHYIFLLSCFFFAIGWKTRWVKWIVLILHISFAYRNPLITYGVESILSSALFILCLAPIGKSFSVDRWLQIRRDKGDNVIPVTPVYQSKYVFMYRRLIQIQMAIFFLFAGIEKLRGEFWWSGDALWVALNNYEFTNISLTFFAEHYWIINLLTYTTIVLEMGYFYLIWQRSTRPWFLVAAIFLHLGIAVFMGLYYFSAVMIFCHLSFVRNEWYEALGIWWQKKQSELKVELFGSA